MPRVLLVSQPTDGGVFRHVRDLAEGLPAHGFDVALAAPPLRRPTRRRHGRRCRSSARPRRTTDARARRGARARGARLRPDIVHAHSSKAGAVARLARVLTPRTPVVYTPHGYAHAGYFESPAQRRVYAVAERALTPLASRDRLRVRGGAPSRPRSRRRRAGARSSTTASTPRPTTPVHPEVAALRAAGQSSRRSRCCGPARGSRRCSTRCLRSSTRTPARSSRSRARASTASASSARARPRRGRGGALPGLRARHRRRAAGRRPVRLAVVGGVLPLRGPGGDGDRASRSSPPASAGRRGGARRRVRRAGRRARRSRARASPRPAHVRSRSRADALGAARPVRR